MSQPIDNGAVAAPGKLDERLGEFWAEYPYDFVKNGQNLSAFERDRTFLNVAGRGFVDISQLTGADSDGDGRSAVAGDFLNNGQLELVVRQTGGGALLLFENHFPRRHYLEVTLRGRTSNRQGIGSRLTAMVGKNSLVRDMYPLNSVSSQTPNRVHFGLDDSTRVQKMTILWPSGLVQELDDLEADRHIVVTEGVQGPSAVETVEPGQTIAP